MVGDLPEESQGLYDPASHALNVIDGYRLTQNQPSPSLDMERNIWDITVGLEESLQKLCVQKEKPHPDIARLGVSPSSKVGKEPDRKKKEIKEIVADSWEDEISSGEEMSEKDEAATGPTTSLASKSEGPLAPPPTPALGTYNSSPSSFVVVSPSCNDDTNSRTVRPEKQTAVASRMIAGALGIRAPKRTEEQRAYDRAMKEKEIKRRNREKEEEARAKQDEERAKAAVWEA